MQLMCDTDGATFIDVGYGRPIKLSSAKPQSAPASHLLPARNPGSAAFQTELEENPFVTIDLETVRQIRRIRVFNEERDPGRASPLILRGSTDGEHWFDIGWANYCFGGRRSDTPLDMMFRERIACRHVKLQVVGKTFLHLDYVEVLAQPPAAELGRYLNVCVEKPRILAEYHHHDSHGFTWTFTYTLAGIINAASAGFEISRVDYSRCLVQFKDEVGADLYPVLFEPTTDRSGLFRLPHTGFQQHGVYVTYQLGVLQQFALAYFGPSARVRAFQAELTRKYGLQPHRAIAVVYRGTDKVTEVPPTPIERYIAQIKVLMEQEPDSQIIVQTDQQQALDEVRRVIPNAIHFDELPMTTGNTVIHDLALQEEFGITKTEFAVRFLAAVHLLAGCRHIVTHTGNVALWLALYRGNADGFYQFDVQNQLRDPKGALADSAE